MKEKLGLIKRLGILAVLVFCLGYVAFTPNTQSVLAAPCCSDCPVAPWDVETTIEEHCAAQCGSTSGTCYTRCVNRAYSCWANCISCGGGGGNCGVCYQPADCLTGVCAGLGSGPNGSGYCTCP